MKRAARRAILLAGFLLAFAAGAAAQSEKVIMPSREVTLRQAVDEISKQAGYKLAVNWNSLDAGRRVMLSGNVLSVGELLDQTLAGTGSRYEVRERHIIVTKAPAEAEGRRGMLAEREFRSAMASVPQSYHQMELVPDPWSRNTLRIDVAGNRQGDYWTTGGDSEKMEVVMIHFRVGKSLLERRFMSNARALDIIDRTFSDMQLVSQMDYVTITAGSSPEGDTAINEKLARDRALAIKSYIMWKHPYIDRDRIVTYSVGEDWTGLRKMIEDDRYMPGRDEALAVIDNPYYDKIRKKAMLKRIGGGRTYRYVADNMLPYLRGGAACMIYFKKEAQPEPEPETVVAAEPPQPQVIVRTDTVYIHSRDTVAVQQPVQPVIPQPKGGYVALKTNMLYDAAMIPNLGLEFSLGRRWSMELEGIGAFWAFEKKHNFYRVGAGSIEVRKWLGKPSRTPLTGHFLGAYGMLGTYNFKMGGTGNKSDGTLSWSAGISYGYSMPIARKLNLEFSLGIGYMQGDYKEYYYNPTDDCYPWVKTAKRTYFGPTKAEVSLVWLIGRGENPGKGKKNRDRR